MQILIQMTFQLDNNEVGEYARLKTKFFGDAKFLLIDPETEADPDFHRYVVLNKKILKMGKFFHRLRNAKPRTFMRIQRYVRMKTRGKYITGFSPAIGLILSDPNRKGPKPS